MAARREVISLSQLLRRSEDSNSRPGNRRVPPLPLQRSSCRTESRPAGDTATPFTERPVYQQRSMSHPLGFMPHAQSASHRSTLQPEPDASSQRSCGPITLSQEVESEQLSVMTSMSQSSFSQTQSQNLLASSQDEQLQRLQQWQAEHAAATTPFSEQIQKLEKSITAALNEQTQKQRFHREELVKEFVSPIKKSIQENHVQLMTSCEEQQRQNLSLEEVVGSVKNVAASVMDLRQQVLNSKSLEHKAFCEENVQAITAEADTVRAALTLLQDRIDSLDGTMKLCSNQVSSVLQGVEIKHNALMAAVTASSCNCPSELALAEHLLDAGRESRKRKRSMSRRDAVEPSQASYSDSSSANESPPPTRSRYQPRHQVDTKNWEPNQGGSIGGLHHALHRIEALSANRRHYRHYQQNF